MSKRSSSPTPPGRPQDVRGRGQGRRIETLTRENDEDDDTVYWADVTVGGRTYAIGVLGDGTLTEMNLAVDEDEVPFDRCPAAVQETFRAEAFGEKVGDRRQGHQVRRPDLRGGRRAQGEVYEVVVAEDGTLVEKVLVIDDEEVELSECPAAVQAGLREHAKGGKIGDSHPVDGHRPPDLRGRGRDQGQGLPDRGRRGRAPDLQVARSRRGLKAADALQRIVRPCWISWHGPLDVPPGPGVAGRVPPLVAELDVDPLQGPQRLTHPRVGLGLGHRLVVGRCLAAPSPALFRWRREPRRPGDHRAVGELADGHRDRVHRADPVAFVIVVEPREAGVDRPQPGDDRPVVALRPAVTRPPAA